MTEKVFKPVILSQIEDALEERQRPDRRQKKAPVPENVNEDRRKVNRREAKPKK